MKSTTTPNNTRWTMLKIESKKQQIAQLEQDLARCTLRQKSKKAGISHAITVLNSTLEKLQSE